MEEDHRLPLHGRPSEVLPADDPVQREYVVVLGLHLMREEDVVARGDQLAEGSPFIPLRLDDGIAFREEGKEKKEKGDNK